ncbi:glycosyltransferase [Shivajiella indica]|uniref:Glycosyltransferase n=1 Tax=Shivajiella indica TaxID=872115 RepID=A0ABW5BFH6_9BACT
MKYTIALPVTKTRFLKETLESIKNQSFQDFELIIRNNGKDKKTKDEIESMVQSWLEKPNVKYFVSEQQLTMPQNFNQILDVATGEYFTVLSDDDLIEPDFLLEIDKLIEQYKGVDVFHCRVIIIDENGEFSGISELCPEFETQLDFVYHRITSKRHFYLSDFVVKTSPLKDIGGFNEKCNGWGLDEITWSILAKKGVAYANQPLLKYRVFSGNHTLSKENLKNRFLDNEIIYETQKKIIEEHPYPALYPKDFLLELNEKRKGKLNDLVFSQYSLSGSFFGKLGFYLRYQKNISIKSLIRNLAK